MTQVKNLSDLSIFSREVYTFHLFCRSDYNATLFPALCIALPLCFRLYYEQHVDLSLLLIKNIPTLLLGIALYIYQFDLSNQINGVEEDEINKPERPLPSKWITKEEAQFRWYIVSFGYFLFGWYHGFLHLSFTWQLCSFLNNFLDFDKNWLWKSFSLGPGTYVLVSTHYMLMKDSTLTDNEIGWSIFLSLVVFINVHLQDFRDVQGDIEKGRRTFPIVFGNVVSRRISSVIHLLTALVPKLFVNGGNSIENYYCIIHFIMFVMMGYRVMQDKEDQELQKKYDRFSYNLLCAWFCVSLVFMVFLV
jgi:4-hydroxybenzoate polyprenyltransferase